MKSDYEGSAAEFTVLHVRGGDERREATSHLLRGEGYHVVEAASGQEALQLATQVNTDLVIIEVDLTDISGVELCRQLKKNPDTAFLSILLTSATPIDSRSYVRGLESGADAYVADAVDPQVFLATVWALLRTARAKASLRRRHDKLEARVAERTKALEAEVRERRQAEASAQRQAASAEALARAATQLSQQLELNAVLEAIYNYISQALEVPVVTVSLYDNVQEQFEPAFAVGLPKGVYEGFKPVPYKLAMQPQTANNLPVITENVQELGDLPNVSVYRELDIRTTVNVNLLRNGELVGRLNIGTVGETRDFSESEITLLCGFADLAALALNNARLYEEVKAGREQLAELNRRLTQAEEDERKRLAQELHDSAGQLATSLQLSLNLAKQDVPEGALRQKLSEAEAIATQLYEEIRRVSHALRPAHLDVLGLNAAIERLCQQFSETARMTVHYEGESLPEMDDAVPVTFYRIAQEALTNTARHAGICDAWVTLRIEGDILRLTVEDDGAGFDVKNVASTGKGLGLRGMRERIELLRGSVEIKSRPGEGTQIEVACRLDVHHSAF